MRATLAVVLVLVALTKADRDWSKVFPNHLENPPHASIPHGIPSPRITGGKEVVPNSIPYQVGLFIEVAEGTSFCGGSLISKQTVATAAHCVDAVKGNVQAYFGAHNVRQNEPNQLRLNVSTIILHPKWSRQTLQNDIALLILDNPLKLTANIQTVKLASDPTNSFEGHEAIASGWGRDSDESNSISPVLRKVTIPIIANSVCNIAYFGVIRDTHICASGLGGKSTCNGDSGGPLTVADELIGITSFGITLGCEIGWPPAFTRVTSYTDWIEEHIV